MRVLRDFRRAVEALEGIAVSLGEAVELQGDNEPALDRLDELERTRGLWEAEVEGLLQKAEGKLKAAANSEARERHQRAKHGQGSDPFDDDRDEVEAAVPAGDVEGGQEEDVHPVYLGLEKNSKDYARRLKFSG